jgi:hypothetical protein
MIAGWYKGAFEMMNLTSLGFVLVFRDRFKLARIVVKSIKDLQ